MLKSIKTEDFFLILSVFFIINPFIKIIPVHVEIQPIYTLFVFIGIVFRGKISSGFLFVFLILSIFLFLGLISTNFDSSSFSTYLAILSLLLLREYFCSNAISTITMHNTIMLCLYTWVFIGLMQAFLPSLLYLTGIDSFLSTLISRYSSEAIGGESARGIRMLAPEPSYAAHIIFFFFSYLILNIKEITSSVYYGVSKYIVLMLLLLIISWKNGSTTLFMMLLLFLFFASLRLLFNLKRSLILIVSLFLLIFLLLNSSFLQELSIDTRFGLILERIFEQDSFLATFKILLVSSGQRMSSVFVGYWTLINFESVYYFGSWSSRFYSNAIESGLDVNKINYFNDITQNVKPYSVVSTLSFDLGWLGFIIGCYLTNINFSVLKKMNSLYFSITITSLFAVFFNSPVALPIYLFLLYYLNLKYKESHGLKSSNS